MIIFRIDKLGMEDILEEEEVREWLF